MNHPMTLENLFSLCQTHLNYLKIYGRNKLLLYLLEKAMLNIIPLHI